MTLTPVTHREGMTIISKQVHRKGSRHQLEEATPDTIPESPAGIIRLWRQNAPGCQRVALTCARATVRDEYHRKAGHVDADTLPANGSHPGPVPSRSDLEFMAECLYGNDGVPLRVVAAAFDDALPGIVGRGTTDPVANHRAQDRIADLLCDLPPGCYYAPARYERQRPPFREPARGSDTRAAPCDLPAPLQQSKQSVESILTQRGFVTA